MGGQSKSQIVGYSHSLYAHFIFGAGVADFVSKIWFRDSDTIAWEGKQDVNGIIAINKPDLFGGKSSQGGIVGNIAFMNGSADQTANDYQVSFRGALTPAYRGVMSVIWQDLNIGMNPYLPTWGVEWSRIHKRMSLDGVSDRVQWYDEKAAIPFGNNQTIDGKLTPNKATEAAIIAAGNAYQDEYNTVYASKYKELFSETGDYNLAVAEATIAAEAAANIVYIAKRTEVYADRSMFTPEHWDYKWYTPRNEPPERGNKKIDVDLTGFTRESEAAFVPFQSGGLDSLWPIFIPNAGVTTMWYRWNFTPKKLQDISLDVSAVFSCEIWLNGNYLDDFSSPKTITVPKSKLLINQNNVIAVRTSGGTPGGTAYYTWRYDGYEYPPLIPNHEYADIGSLRDDGIQAMFNKNAKVYGGSNINTYFSNFGAPEPNYNFMKIITVRISDGTVLDDQNLTILSKLYPAAPASPNTITVTSSIATEYDMNPIHWLREFKTEPWSSARIDESKLPDDVWMAAADTVYDEGLGVTFFYDGSQSIEAAMADVCRHIGAETYSDRRTGEFKIKLIRNDYDVETIPSLDESSIIDMSKDDTPIFGQLTTDVVVNYTDTENAFVEASITVQDIALAQQQGKRITANLDYKGFTSGQVAGRKAQQMLNTLSKPLQKRRFVVRTSAGKNFNKGDVFKFSWERENIVDMVMRITDLNFGNGVSNRVMIDAVQDEFAMPSTSFVAPPSSDWSPPYSEPTALNDRLIIEAPYLELVQLRGQSIVDLQLSDAPESSYLIGAAGSQSNATKAMMFDGISTYEQIGVLDFCPTATMDQDIGYLDETFDITNVKNISEIVIGSWFQIDNELMRVDVISETSMTVGRGVLDTIPALHTAGAKIYFWDNASLTDSTEFVTGNTVNMKLLTINPKGQLALADAPVDSIVMVGRPSRPYNVANLKLNNVYYNDTINGDLVLDFANRNRLMQTSSTIYGFFDGNITPESGVTVTANLLDASDLSVVHSVTGATGITNTIAQSTLEILPVNLILELFAVRDGLESYQKYQIPFTNLNAVQGMLYEDSNTMVYEDNNRMVYE